MFYWLRSRIAALLRHFGEKEIRRLLDSGRFDYAYELTSSLIKGRDNDLVAQALHSRALIGLERFEEALEIAERFERLVGNGVIQMSAAWLIDYARLKCYSLYGLHDYDALVRFVHRCRQRYPKELPFAAFDVLAAIERGVESGEGSLQFLDENVSRIDEPWLFIALSSGHDWLGNYERARQIAEIAGKRYPDDPAVRDLGSKRERS